MMGGGVARPPSIEQHLNAGAAGGCIKVLFCFIFFVIWFGVGAELIENNATEKM